MRCREQGLPEPELQVAVHDADGFVSGVDHPWREQRVVGVADGLGEYEDPGVLRAEELREDRLRDAGSVVVRHTWAEAYDQPARLTARVRAAFVRARRRAR